LLNDVGVDHENGNPSTTLLPSGLSEMLIELKSLFEGDLIPVAPKAQRKVQLPDGLDLDEWINGPPPSDTSSSEDEEEGKDGLFVSASEKTSDKGSRKDSFEPTPDELEKVRKIHFSFLIEILLIFEFKKIREARKMLQAHNPNYLKASSPGSSRKNGDDEMKDAYDNIDEIPIAELSLDIPLKVHCEFYISFI
jgi:AP-3 complex subunit delta